MQWAAGGAVARTRMPGVKGRLGSWSWYRNGWASPTPIPPTRLLSLAPLLPSTRPSATSPPSITRWHSCLYAALWRTHKNATPRWKTTRRRNDATTRAPPLEDPPDVHRRMGPANHQHLNHGSNLGNSVCSGIHLHLSTGPRPSSVCASRPLRPAVLKQSCVTSCPCFPLTGCTAPLDRSVNVDACALSAGCSH